MQSSKAKSFTDLVVWKMGHALVIEIYTATSTFPREEMYGLTSQIRRAVVSFTSNIAEGFTRRNRKEKMQFYYIALGSLAEVQNQLVIARDVGFIEKNTFNNLATKTVELSKILNGLIRSLNKF